MANNGNIPRTDDGHVRTSIYRARIRDSLLVLELFLPPGYLEQWRDVQLMELLHPHAVLHLPPPVALPECLFVVHQFPVPTDFPTEVLRKLGELQRAEPRLDQ